MKRTAVVCGLFVVLALLASVPLHAQSINTDGVCENDLKNDACIPNPLFAQTYLQIFGQNLQGVTGVTVTLPGSTPSLPILFNNGSQINVCLAILNPPNPPDDYVNATITVKAGSHSASITIPYILPFSVGQSFYGSVLRNCGS